MMKCKEATRTAPKYGGIKTNDIQIIFITQLFFKL